MGISIVKEYSEKVKPPRTVFLRWPFGHPLGEPGNILQQRAVLAEAFKAVIRGETPGEITEPPFAWRRHKYTDEAVDTQTRRLRSWAGKQPAGVAAGKSR